MASKEMFLQRKLPKQKRSKAMVRAVLDAAARIFVEEGYDKASTNRVAEVAGVSIGSLYQYFPNKESLVLALFQEHCARMESLLIDSTTTLADMSLETAVHSFVSAMMKVHAIQPKLHRILITELLHLSFEYVREIEQRTRALVHAFLSQRQHEILPKDLELASFVLVSSVESIALRALLEESSYFGSCELEDEICAVILRYLTGKPS